MCMSVCVCVCVCVCVHVRVCVRNVCMCDDCTILVGGTNKLLLCQLFISIHVRCYVCQCVCVLAQYLWEGPNIKEMLMFYF